MTDLAPEPADRAIARVLAGGLDRGFTYRREVRIDATSANYASTGPLTVPFEACDRVPTVGEPAFVYAPEGAESRAVITGIDEGKRLVRFEVLPWDLSDETQAGARTIGTTLLDRPATGDATVYRTPRPGDLLAVRTTDPNGPETQVVIDRVVDGGSVLLMAGRWGAIDLEVLVRRVGDTTNRQET